MPRIRIGLANKKAARITRLEYAATKSTKYAPICNLIGQFAKKQSCYSLHPSSPAVLKPAGCEQPAGALVW
jgi:hypothetical protein